jgi:hypothetical protein
LLFAFNIFCFCFPDPEDPYTLSGATRQLGLTMCRGTTVMLIMPVDGTQVLHENPFLQAGQDEQLCE